MDFETLNNGIDIFWMGFLAEISLWSFEQIEKKYKKWAFPSYFMLSLYSVPTVIVDGSDDTASINRCFKWIEHAYTAIEWKLARNFLNYLTFIWIF